MERTVVEILEASGTRLGVHSVSPAIEEKVGAFRPQNLPTLPPRKLDSFQSVSLGDVISAFDAYESVPARDHRADFLVGCAAAIE